MMKKRHIILSSILAAALGIGVAALAFKQDVRAAHAALEDEELVETFGFEDYNTYEVDSLESLTEALRSGNAYINVRKNIYTNTGGVYTAINVSGLKYINLNGYALLGAKPGVLKLNTGSSATIVHGRIAPDMAFDLNNDNLWYDNTINVYNATLTLRDVTVVGTRSAISMYNSTVNIMDGCDIDCGAKRYNPQTQPHAADFTASFAIGGNSKLNISGGSITGQMEPHAWCEENRGVGYQGDSIESESEVNISGGKINLRNLFRMGGSSVDTSELVHLYGGKLDLTNFFVTDSDYSNLGHESRYNKNNIYNYLREDLQSKYDDMVCDSDSQQLAFFIAGGNTYNNFVDAVLANARVYYWYVSSQLSDESIQVTDPSQLPDSFASIGYFCQLEGAQVTMSVYLNQAMSVSNRLSFNKYGAPVTEKTVLEKESAVVYTDYFYSSLNGNKYYAYRGAQRQTYEWTLTNTATGYTKTEKGYSAFKIPTGNVAVYEISCKITATNKYGIDQDVQSKTAKLTVNSYISGNLKIKFAKTSNNTVDAVFDEMVTLTQDISETLNYSSNAKLDYQWYSSYYSDMRSPYPMPGATKSVYDYKVDYVGQRYFQLGVTARKTSGAFDFNSEEILSNVLCVNGKNFDKLIVRKDSVDKDVALGTEVLFQVSVIGAPEASDLRYSWFIENDNGTYSAISDMNSVNIRYEGTKTPNLTICRNDANGTYKYFCYVTDVRNNISLTSKSEAFVLTYRDAGLPIIKTQPSTNLSYGESETSLNILGLDARSPDYGATLEYLWYKSTTCFPEGDTQFDPSSLKYESTGKTVATPTFNNPGVGIWFYYCVVTNKVNGHTASINTQYVQVSVTSHTHAMTTSLKTAMPEEINLEVDEQYLLSYEFEVKMNGGANPQSITVYGEIYNEQLACGSTIAQPATIISQSGDTTRYEVKAYLKISAVGRYVLDGCITASSSISPYYDQDYLRGDCGITGLTTVVNVYPKNNIPNILNVSRNTTSELIGNYDVGDFDYYRGISDLDRSGVYDGEVNRLGDLATYDNFKKYELYIENATGTMVKAGESENRNNLPSFNFNTFNESLPSEDRYADDFDGTLNAYVRVIYDMPTQMLDIDISAGGVEWKRGLYVLQDQFFDSEVFAICVVGECEHKDSRYERCNHEKGVVEVICYACGEIVEEMPLHLHEVAGVAATCCDDGIATHMTCDYCDKVFTNLGEEVTLESLVIPATGHNYVRHEAKDPTCTEKGNIEYYECSECHEIFLLVEGNYIEVHLEDVLIDVSHKVSANWSHNSQGHYHVCEECGQIIGEIEPHSDSDGDGYCDVCGRDLNAAVETVHVTVVNGKFADGSKEADIEVGAVVTVIADAFDDGRTFDGWYINGVKVSGDVEARIVITEACSIEARFSNIPTPVPPVDPGDGGKKKGGLPAGAIVGIVIGSVLLLAAGGFAIYWFVIKKKTFKDLFPKKKQINN